ncbi:hypothetical protein [Brucella pseudogrignonensis]|uniref:Peptidase C39-like domain-containing protein n=1 Tax=Brucella pseudogrignonensis TaxID=419475 RepID=A0ABU1M5Z3_9HYPH|nr:hypothetical protein [Brucella pseudogrignonensis]MDR6431247.1 hypothetical protein [Brucella pseudogrignonensis]
MQDILFHKQKFKHDPAAGTWGDCWRTCVACILRLPVENVPHVFDKGVSSKEAHAAMKEFLDLRGIHTISTCFKADGMDLDGFLSITAGWFGDMPFMLIGRSANDTNHVVIARNGAIIHDPSLDLSGIVGPHHEGDGKFYWSGDLLVRPAARGIE